MIRIIDSIKVTNASTIAIIRGNLLELLSGIGAVGRGTVVAFTFCVNCCSKLLLSIIKLYHGFGIFDKYSSGDIIKG